MKKLSILFSCLFPAIVMTAQNVAINNDGSSAATSAMLDVKSTTKGFMMPRMTSAERTSVSSPVLGLMVFDTDTKTIWAYDGSSWKNLYTSGGLTLPFSQSVNVSTPVFQVENSGTGDVLFIGNTGSGGGLNLYSTTGMGINVNTTGNIGIKATSWNSNAIHAFTNNPNNTIPTIRGNNMGAGDGVYGNTSAASKAGVRGEGNSGSSFGVWGNNNNASGVGVYGKADLGIGVEALSQNGTGLLAFSGTGYALDASGKVRIAGGNTNPTAGAVLTSDANGNATWQQPAKIGFRATGSNLTFNSIPSGDWWKVTFANESYDFGNNFTAYAGTLPFADASLFTAPVNGVYTFASNLFIITEGLDEGDFAGAGIRLAITRNGNTFYTEDMPAYEVYFNPSSPTQVLVDLKTSNEMYLLAGDKVFVQLNHFNTDDVPALVANNKSYFHGRLAIPD